MIASATLYEALLYVSVVIFVATVAVYLRWGRASLFHPATVYLAFHGITFVVRPLLVYYLDYHALYDAFSLDPSWSDKITVIVAANLGLLTFMAASLMFGRAVPRFRPISDAERDSYIKPLLITCLIVGPLGAMSLWQTYTPENGITMDLTTGIAINTQGNGYMQSAQLMLATLVGMIAYLCRFRLWSLLPFAIFVALRAGTGGRGPFISAAFFLILLYLFEQRQRWFTKQAAVLAAGVLVLFRLVGDDRGRGIQRLLGFKVDAWSGQDLRFLESMDWANMEFFEYLVYVIPQRSGTYDYFASLLQIFTEPIPRILWPDKPIGAPVKFFNLLDYGGPIGMTYSLPGAGWMELGWLGVVIMCVAVAWLYGRAHDKFMTSRQSPISAMFYAAFASTAIVSFRDGVVISILKQSLFYLAPVVVLYVVHRTYGQHRDAPASDAIASHGAQAAPSRPALTPRERRRARAGEMAQVRS